MRVTGALLPHAPLLLPQVTPEQESLRDIWDALTRVKAPADAIVVVLTPHAELGVYSECTGSLADFGIPGVTGEFERAQVEVDLPELNGPLDHGALVPLLLLDVRVPVLAVGGAAVAAVRDLAREREVFVVASAHTSVRLTERAPLPYSFDAVRLESRFITGLESDCAIAAELADELAHVGDTCSRSTLSAFGELFAGSEGRVLAYGAPFGVGYPVVTAETDV